MTQSGLVSGPGGGLKGGPAQLTLAPLDDPMVIKRERPIKIERAIPAELWCKPRRSGKLPSTSSYGTSERPVWEPVIVGKGQRERLVPMSAGDADCVSAWIPEQVWTASRRSLYRLSLIVRSHRRPAAKPTPLQGDPTVAQGVASRSTQM